MLDRQLQYEYRLRQLKRWIWIYFCLLIFEGTLRKWVLPSLSGPLLLIRDPVVLMIYFRAYTCGKFPMKRMWPFAVLAGAIGLLACAQVVQEIISLPIALYGLRSYILHPPLMFVMADTLDEEDIYKVGRWFTALAAPMFALVLWQFNSPSSDPVNAGAGENAEQMIAASGHIRPAGPFSYGVGMQAFEVLLSAFVLDGLMHKRRYPAWMLYSALFACIGMLPLLGSRMAVIQLAVVAFFTIFSSVSRGQRLVAFTKTAAVLILAALIVFQFSFFREGLDTLQTRWEMANAAEGGDLSGVLNKRVLGNLQDGLRAFESVPWEGHGIGLGSNFAAATMSGTLEFLAGEDEWGRVVYEFGPMFGLLFMGARVALGLYVVLQALRSLRGNSVLAWLLVPGVVPLMVLTIMEQATFLGFMVFGGGLCLAAARVQEPSPAYWVYEPIAASAA